MSKYMTTRLRDHILGVFHKDILPKLLRHTEEAIAKYDAPYILFPFCIDFGVFDYARYNVAEKRFDRLEIAMAVGDVTPTEWGDKFSGYCDESKIEYIELPDERQVATQPHVAVK